MSCYAYIYRLDHDQQITEKVIPVTTPDTIPPINPTADISIAEASTIMLDNDHDEEDSKSNARDRGDNDIHGHCEPSQHVLAASTLSYIPEEDLEESDPFADLLWYMRDRYCYWNDTCMYVYVYVYMVHIYTVYPYMSSIMQAPFTLTGYEGTDRSWISL